MGCGKLYVKHPSDRVCKKCGEVKPQEQFYKHPFGEGGRDTKCKDCAKAYARERRKDPTVAAQLQEYDRNRRKDDEAKAKRRIFMKEKRKEPIVKLSKKMRYLLYRCVRFYDAEKSGNTFHQLGYTPEQLKQRIECQFKRGMSWDNYGRDTWHIDHKKPVLAFFNQGVTDPRTINALANLQPLWAHENVSKGWSWPVGSNENLRRPEAARLTAANDNRPSPLEETA